MADAAEIKQLKQQVQDLQCSLEACDIKAQAASARAGRAERSSGEVATSMKANLKLSLQREQHNDSIAKECETLKGELLQADESRTALQQQHIELQAQAASLQLDLQRTQDELAAGRADAEKDLSKLQGSLLDCQTRCSQLEQENTAATAAVEIATKRETVRAAQAQTEAHQKVLSVQRAAEDQSRVAIAAAILEATTAAEAAAAQKPQAALQSAAVESSATLVQRQAEHTAATGRTEQAHQAALQSAALESSATLDQRQAEHTAATGRTEQAHQELVQQLQQQQEAAVGKLKGEHEAEVKALQAEQSNKLKEQDRAHQAAQAEGIAKQQEAQQAFNARLQATEAEKQKLDDQLRAAQAGLDQARTSAAEAAEGHRAALHSLQQDLEAAVSTERSKLESQKQGHESALTQVKVDCKGTVAALRAALDEQVQHLETALSGERAGSESQRQEHQSALAQVQADCDNTVAEMRASSDTLLKTLEQQAVEDRRLMTEQAAADLATVQVESVTAVAAAEERQRSSDAAAQEAQDQLEQMRDEMRALQEKLAAVTEDASQLTEDKESVERTLHHCRIDAEQQAEALVTEQESWRDKCAAAQEECRILQTRKEALEEQLARSDLELRAARDATSDAQDAMQQALQGVQAAAQEMESAQTQQNEEMAALRETMNSLVDGWKDPAEEAHETKRLMREFEHDTSLEVAAIVATIARNNEQLAICIGIADEAAGKQNAAEEDCAQSVERADYYEEAAKVSLERRQEIKQLKRELSKAREEKAMADAAHVQLTNQERLVSAEIASQRSAHARLVKDAQAGYAAKERLRLMEAEAAALRASQQASVAMESRAQEAARKAKALMDKELCRRQESYRCLQKAQAAHAEEVHEAQVALDELRQSRHQWQQKAESLEKSAQQLEKSAHQSRLLLQQHASAQLHAATAEHDHTRLQLDASHAQISRLQCAYARLSNPQPEQEALAQEPSTSALSTGVQIVLQCGNPKEGDRSLSAASSGARDRQSAPRQSAPVASSNDVASRCTLDLQVRSLSADGKSDGHASQSSAPADTVPPAQGDGQHGAVGERAGHAPATERAPLDLHLPAAATQQSPGRAKPRKKHAISVPAPVEGAGAGEHKSESTAGQATTGCNEGASTSLPAVGAAARPSSYRSGDQPTGRSAADESMPALVPPSQANAVLKQPTARTPARKGQQGTSAVAKQKPLDPQDADLLQFSLV